MKVVQVSILRIVTFELVRQMEAREELRLAREEAKLQRKKSKVAGKKGRSPAELAKVANLKKSTYLASDIQALAQVVKHFRFDRTFSQGLHSLILSIRHQKKDVADKKEARPALKRKRRAAGRGDARHDCEASEGEARVKRSKAV